MRAHEGGRSASLFFFWATLGGLSVLVAALVLAYLPGLHGPFLFDDRTSITTNPSLALTRFDAAGLWQALRSGESGLLGRPLAYLSFALNFYAAQGFEPLAFKATNVAIHLTNALLVYRLLSLLGGVTSPSPRDRSGVGGAAARRPGLPFVFPLLGAALWSLHPVQLTSVLYTVQRMTSLSALGVLVGLVVFVQARAALPRRGPSALLGMGAGIGIGTLLGLGAKENAVLLAPLAALLEWTLFGRGELPASDQRRLRWFYLGVVGVPVLIGLGYLAGHPGLVLDEYLNRRWTPIERLLTEGRVLFYYLSLIAVPRTSALALVHDDIVVSRGLLDPWTTGAALLGWAVLVSGAVRLRRREPWLALAVLWYLLAHGVESSILALDIAHEHRNYVPSIMLAAAAAWYLSRWRGGRAAALAACLGLGLVTWVRAGAWQDSEQLTASLVRHRPGSALAHGLRAQHLIESGAPVAETYAELQALARLDRDNVTALFEMIRMVSAGRLGAPAPAVGGAAAAATADPAAARLALTLPLPFAPAGLASVEAALHAEARQRLRQAPIGAPMVQALYEMVECVLRDEPRCARLHATTRDWLETVLLARTFAPRLRAALWSQAARLAAVTDPRRALAYQRVAVQAAPRAWVGLERLFHLALAAGDRAAALDALARLERLAGEPLPALRRAAGCAAEPAASGGCE